MKGKIFCYDLIDNLCMERGKKVIIFIESTVKNIQPGHCICFKSSFLRLILYVYVHHRSAETESLPALNGFVFDNRLGGPVPTACLKYFG